METREGFALLGAGIIGAIAILRALVAALIANQCADAA
jgi:hypothetical protein